jgi:hypothetical protein
LSAVDLLSYVWAAGKARRFFGAISPSSRRCFIITRQPIIDAGMVEITNRIRSATLKANDLLSSVSLNRPKEIAKKKSICAQWIGGVFSCLIAILLSFTALLNYNPDKPGISLPVNLSIAPIRPPLTNTPDTKPRSSGQQGPARHTLENDFLSQPPSAERPGTSLSTVLESRRGRSARQI